MDNNIVVNSDIQKIKEDIVEIKILLKKNGEAEQLRNENIIKDVKNNTVRITNLEDNQKWLWRTTFGAIIGAIVSIVFLFIKIGMGVN